MSFKELPFETSPKPMDTEHAESQTNPTGFPAWGSLSPRSTRSRSFGDLAKASPRNGDWLGRGKEKRRSGSGTICLWFKNGVTISKMACPGKETHGLKSAVHILVALLCPFMPVGKTDDLIMGPEVASGIPGNQPFFRQISACAPSLGGRWNSAGTAVLGTKMNIPTW